MNGHFYHKPLLFILILLLFCFLFVNAAFVSAQSFGVNKGVVKITAYRSDQKHIGTGIVVGKAGDLVFIVTALHVWLESDSQKVLFSQSRPDSFVAKPFYRFSDEFDIGVLMVELSPDSSLYKDLPKLLKGDFSLHTISDSIISIGHPLKLEEGWQTTKINIARDSRKLVLTKTHTDTLTKKEIDSGYFGSPILIIDEQQKPDERLKLIGIITKIDKLHARAIQIDEILKLLKDWGIPTNLIQRPPVMVCGAISVPLTNRKISFLTASVGMLTSGSFGWYLTAKKKADDKFAEYRTAKSTEEAVSRRIKTEKARTRRNVAGYVSIGSGSIFAIMLVRDLIRCKPQEIEDAFVQSPELDEGNKLGFRLNAEPDGHALCLNVHLNF